jgi:hypothetical protein
MDADTANFIAWHQPSRPRDELAAQVDERAEEIEILKKTLERRPGNLVALAEEARALAGLRHWLQPDSAGIVSLLQLAARAIGASGASLGPNGIATQARGPRAPRSGPAMRDPLRLSPTRRDRAVRIGIA